MDNTALATIRGEFFDQVANGWWEQAIGICAGLWAQDEPESNLMAAVFIQLRNRADDAKHAATLRRKARTGLHPVPDSTAAQYELLIANAAAQRKEPDLAQTALDAVNPETIPVEHWEKACHGAIDAKRRCLTEGDFGPETLGQLKLAAGELNHAQGPLAVHLEQENMLLLAIAYWVDREHEKAAQCRQSLKQELNGDSWRKLLVTFAGNPLSAPTAVRPVFRYWLRQQRQPVPSLDFVS